MKGVIFKLLKNKYSSPVLLHLLNRYRSIKSVVVNYEYQKAIKPDLSLDEIRSYNMNRKLGARKALCFAPKTAILFTRNGDAIACCLNRKYVLGNIRSMSIRDIWFGKKRRKLDELVNEHYDLSEGCIECKMKIRSGDHISVQAQNFDFHINRKSLYPSRLEFEMDITCNLECIMCDGEFSSSIRTNREKREKLPFVYDDEFLEQLEEFIPHATYANFIGGEPTLIQYYHRIWEKIIELNPSCIIHIQTNGTHLPDKFRSLLERGNFEIGLSIDSLDESRFVAIRKNLIWKKFNENLRYYLGLYKADKIKLTVNYCPMPCNREDLIPIIEFGNTHHLPIFFCTVLSPYHLSYMSRDSDYLKKVIDELSPKVSQGSNYYSSNNYNQLNDFIKLLASYTENALTREKYLQKNDGKGYKTLLRELEDKFETLIISDDIALIKRELIECIEFQLNNEPDDFREHIIKLILSMPSFAIVVNDAQSHLELQRIYIRDIIINEKSIYFTTVAE